jgi:methyl-CpG-binding domain protein 4
MTRLFQETWRRRPFWMLVGCILVNRATWAKAEGVHREIMRRFPTPGLLTQAPRGELEALVRPLGLQRTRANNLIELAKVWQCERLHDRRKAVMPASGVLSLPGCGRYAADSWAIFVEGRRAPSVKPTDAKLKAYLLRLDQEDCKGMR